MPLPSLPFWIFQASRAYVLIWLTVSMDKFRFTPAPMESFLWLISQLWHF